MENNIFISYTLLDFEQATKVKMFLESNDYHCFAVESLYTNEIEDMIQKCKAVVVILSDKAQNSDSVYKEIRMAVKYKKIIIPFHIDESEIYNPFKCYFADRHLIEAYNNFTMACEELLSVLKQLRSVSGKVLIQSKKEELVSYNTFKIYIAIDDGMIVFSSNLVKNDVEEKYIHFSGEMKSIITTQLENIFSILYQIDRDKISIDYKESDSIGRVVPSSKPHWAAWSVDNDYKIRFRVNHFDSNNELLYHGFNFELGNDLELCFFSHYGKYLYDNEKKPLPFSQLGIDEDKLIAAVTDLLRLSHPGKAIVVQKKFVPVFYEDGSGGYHLKFLLR